MDEAPSPGRTLGDGHKGKSAQLMQEHSTKPVHACSHEARRHALGAGATLDRPGASAAAREVAGAAAG